MFRTRKLTNERSVFCEKMSQRYGYSEVRFIDTDDNYLAHFGVKGMKWGVRRYQDENGSLTAEGKKRYEQKAKRYALSGKDKPASDRVKKLPQPEKVKKNKKPSNMTDQELRDHINHMKLEKEYKQLKMELSGKASRNNNGGNNNNNNGGAKGQNKKPGLLSKVIEQGFVNPAIKVLSDGVRSQLGKKLSDVIKYNKELDAQRESEREEARIERNDRSLQRRGGDILERFNRANDSSRAINTRSGRNRAPSIADILRPDNSDVSGDSESRFAMDRLAEAYHRRNGGVSLSSQNVSSLRNRQSSNSMLSRWLDEDSRYSPRSQTRRERRREERLDRTDPFHWTSASSSSSRNSNSSNRKKRRRGEDPFAGVIF